MKKTTKTPKRPAAKETTAVVPAPLTDTEIAGQLTTQYRAVVAATGQMLREAVHFGAMLMELETIVGKSKGGYDSEGTGLKAWLASHCPEINYSSAIVYKSLAAKASTLIGGMGLQALVALQGGDKVTRSNGEDIVIPGEMIERRDKLFEECDSRRKLEQAYFSFMADAGRAGAPRTPKAAIEYRKVRRSEEENAVAVIWPMVKPVLTHRGAWMKAVTLVPTAKLEEAADTIEEFLGAIRAELKRR